MLTILFAAALAAQPAAPVIITARGAGRSCRVSVDGRQLALPVNERRLFARFRRYRRDERSVIFRLAPDTPYRCIGPVVYLAQRAHLTISTGVLGNGLER